MGIVGGSGSGKSTPLNGRAGDLAPDGGEMLFDTRRWPERHPQDVKAQRRMLSRTGRAFVHLNPRGGLRVGSPPVEMPANGSTTAPGASPADCIGGHRSPATW